jgi:hypothetical protein
MLVLSGLLTGLTLVLPSLGFLQWVSIIPASIVLFITVNDQKVGYKAFYSSGIVYFGCFYVTVFQRFFYMYPLDFAGLD